jgi:hypothetical protein
VPGFLPLNTSIYPTLSFEPVLPFSLLSPSVLMKLVLEINTEPVTQASIIVVVVAFSSGSLVLITIYLQSFLVCVFVQSLSQSLFI